MDSTSGKSNPMPSLPLNTMANKKKETCFYCREKIKSIPFRVRPPNKLYKYNYAHKKCLDENKKCAKSECLTHTSPAPAINGMRTSIIG